MNPNTPRYVSPKERAPAALAVMMLGYSDQAPGWLRRATIALDGAFGFPVLWLIQKIAA